MKQTNILKSQIHLRSIFLKLIHTSLTATIATNFASAGLAVPLNGVAQSLPAPDAVDPVEPADLPNPTEQTLPPAPALLRPPAPASPPPNLQIPTLPTAPIEPSPPAFPDQLPIRQIKLLGSPLLHPVLRSGIADEQTEAAIRTLVEQSSCNLITPTLTQLQNLNQPIEELLVPIDNCTAGTFDDLVRLRTAVTLLYTSNGYITSGAFIPNNQDLQNGVLQLQVIEGEMERIDLCLVSHSTEVRAADTTDEPPDCGSATLGEAYVRSRLNLAATTPLSRDRLERALQLLQIDPLVQQVNADLTAGSSPGRSVLQLTLREAPPFQASISVDNYQSPSIGSEQASVFASYANLLGLGDRLSAQYGVTKGLDLYDFNYSLPVNPQDGTLSFRHSNNDSGIVTDQFEDLGIESQARTFSVGFRQPLIRSPETEFALGLSFDWRRSQTFILEDRPYSFSDGVENGEAKVSVLRFTQDWVDRNQTQVFAVRAQFSFGLDAFDATVNDSGTDGRFFAWLGQFQYVQRLVPSPLLLVTRLNAQLTPDSLLSLERFSMGGVESVRGYAQNQLVADNGVFGSIELRIPLTDDPSRLQLVPFVEAGHGWNNRTPDPEEDWIAGIGFGVRWRITPDLNLRLDYGLPLTEIVDRGNSLQEHGIYFSLQYQPF